MALKKYVAYDPSSFEFKGFYSEGRKDLPVNSKEVNPITFMQDKGNNTHYNPNTGWYFIQAEVDAALLLANRAWRDNLLTLTDKYIIADYPINSSDLINIKLFRKELRDYPITWVKPTAPLFIST